MNSNILNNLSKLETRINNRSLGETVQDLVHLELIQRYPHIAYYTLKRICRPDDWQSWISQLSGWRSIMENDHEATAWNEALGVMMVANFHGGPNASFAEDRALRSIFGAQKGGAIHLRHSVTFRTWGDRGAAQQILQLLHESFPDKSSDICWYFDLQESPLRLPLSTEFSPCTSMYPFLREMNMTLDELYTAYYQSASSILLLIGPPGTGKSTFIRGYLNHTKGNAIVSYDPKILEKDHIFSDFLAGDADTLVIEDADELLRKREDGNDAMQRFLSIGDGLIQIRHKKLIFSTNLGSLSRVDPALLRPGRCFSILHFRPLKLNEACQLMRDMERPQIPVSEKQAPDKMYTLAELLMDTPVDKVPQGNQKGVGFRTGFL